MPSAIDPTLPIQGAPTTASVRSNFQHAHDEISALQTTAVGAPFIQIAGGPSFSGPLFVNPTGTAPPPLSLRFTGDTGTAPFLSGTLLGLSADVGGARISMMTAAGPLLISGRAAGGTLKAPTATPQGALFGLNMGGYDGANWQGARASVSLVAEQAWTATANPTHIEFNVTPIGTTAQIEAMRIGPTGALMIGSTTLVGSERLRVAGDINVTGAVFNGPAAFTQGVGYGTTAATGSDLTRHINLYGGSVGINAAANLLNIVTNGQVIAAFRATQVDMRGVLTASGGFAVFDAVTTPVTAKPSISGSRGANAALASVIAALVAYGLAIDNTTA